MRGAGIVSCIGNDMATVEASLRAGRSGIKAVEKFTELGLSSQGAGGYVQGQGLHELYRVGLPGHQFQGQGH